MIKGTITVHKNLNTAKLKSDLSELTRKEIADKFRPIFSKLNKRISRLEQAKGVISPALEAVKKSGGKFYMKGLDRNSLLKEVSRAIAFDSSATGTVTGARVFTENLKSVMGERVEDKEYVGRVFDLVHKVSELNPTITNAIGSTEVARIVSDMVEESIALDLANQEEYENVLNKDFDYMIDDITDKLESKLNGMFDGMATSFTM